MKQLLYIPSGKYVVFPENNGSSIEELVAYYKKLDCHKEAFGSIELVIENLIIHKKEWNRSVYASAEIDRYKPLYLCEFEVVDV